MSDVHDNFYSDYSNPPPRTDQRTAPIAVMCGHADCAESPELARACRRAMTAKRFAMPNPVDITWGGECAYTAIMAVFTQFGGMRHWPQEPVFRLPVLTWNSPHVLIVNYSPTALADFFGGNMRGYYGAMRDGLEAVRCYSIDRGSHADIYKI